MVQPGSIAEELEIEPGDELISINDQEIEDVFDYHYLVNDDYLTVLIRKTNGEEWELEIEKDYEEDLGIEFDNGLMDEYRSCRNNCIFCFIDQMPPGMRETLYFKDDDSRLSFLQGNYVTLTNMSDHDIDRIIKYHLGPINISFQTTNPQLRCKMLHNRFAGDIFPKVQRLYEAGIEMNGQIVLCKGVNDGEELERSIRDLSRYLPHLRSVSIVPVGLSKYRDGLYPLEPFTKEDAQNVLECVHRWQKMLYAEYGLHFIHCSDEWYILAEQSMPPEEQYDGYLQLENGVGMLRLLDTEIQETVQGLEGNDTLRHFSVATGKLAVPCPACSAAVLFKHMRILFKRNLFVPVKSSSSGNNIFSFRKPCLLQLLSDIINQAVDRMVRIVQCPFTKQNLLQMFPADSLFSAMENQLQYQCKLRLFFLLCDQGSPLIFHGKITEHFYIQNLVVLRFFVLHIRSTCLHTSVYSLLKQPLS